MGGGGLYDVGKMCQVGALRGNSYRYLKDEWCRAFINSIRYLELNVLPYY